MNIALTGYKGKMGQIVLEELKKQSSVNEIFCVDIDTIPLLHYLKNEQVDLVIDFTNAASCYEYAKLCLAHDINFISGATNLSEEKLKYIHAVAKEKNLSFMICSNFALGVNALLKIIPILDNYFPQAEIIEHHHESKIDKPSGTAKLIQKKLKNKDVKIISIRDESYQIIHTVNFVSSQEKITIIHEVLDKKVFVFGLLYVLRRLNTWKGLKTNFIIK